MIKYILLTLLLANLSFAGKYHPAVDYIFPLPDSKLLPIHATVILKLQEAYNTQITNLPKLIEVRGESGAYSGVIFFAADDRTIIFRPNKPFQLDEKIDVRIQTSQFPGNEDLAFSFNTVANSANELDGLPKTSIQKEPLQAPDSPVRVVNGVAVPSDFPQIRTNEYSETAPGRLFFASTGPGNGYGNYIVICNNDGTPYFYRRYPDIPRTGNLTVHPTGVMSFHCYEIYDIILDHNFVEIDTVWPGHGYYADDHELQILENGNMLLVARDHVRIDMSKIVSGGHPNATVEAHHFQELDKDHNVIFEWRNWDYLDIRDTYVSLTGNFIDFVHLNSIAIDYDGHFIVSLREYKTIAKINRRTGEMIWKFGGRDSDFRLVNEDKIFSFQHDVRPVPGKPNHYTLFDNGRERNPQFSSAVEYKLNLTTMTAEKVWEFRHNPDWYSGWMGSVQRFSNGNTLIDWPGGSIRTNEVTNTGETVWEMYVTGTETYRCRRYEWDAEMQSPYLILENLGTTVRLIFNKFGDADVKYYNIYAGQNARSQAFLDSTRQTWYDIDAASLGNGSHFFFRVTAVDDKDEESNFSNLESAHVRIVAPGENAIRDSDFLSTAAWELGTSGGAKATGQVTPDGMYQISISASGANLSDVQLRQDNLLVMNGKDYVFEFDAYAGSDQAIGAKIESADSRRVNYGKINNTAISTRLRHYKYEFSMRYPTDPKTRVVFDCGGASGNVFIDNVSLTYRNINENLQPLAKPWQSRDVGMPAVPGEAGMREEKFLIRASGDDIWTQSDAFHFIYAEVNGDVEIIAHVYSLEESDPWSKAGVMMRNSLQAESRHAMMVLTPQNGAAFQRRVSDGGNSTHTAGTMAQTPYWVRLVRKGDLFSGYESSDGALWRLVDSDTISMQDKFFVGLPVTSHNDGVICEAQFDHVQLKTISKVAENEYADPNVFKLHPAYPNPFNPKTTIQYDITIDSQVMITVCDVQGRFICTLVNQPVKSGTHMVVWNGKNDSGIAVASGLYFYQMIAGEFNEIRKMTLVR